LIPVIVASLLVFYENSVLNPEGSHVAWQRNIPNFATVIATDDGKVFTMDISGNVNCYDSQSGTSVWNGSSVGGYFAKGLTVAEGRVYGGYHYASVGCLDEATGQFQWNRMYTAGINQAPDNLIVKDGHLFVIAEGPGAGVTALNASTGEILWQTPYHFDTFGNITDSKTWWVNGYPLGGDPFEGNTVYALGGNTSKTNIFKLNADDGSILWRSNLTSFAGIPSVLTTYQGQVIIESGNQILSLNQTSGDSLWNIDVGATIYSPTDYQGVLLFGASDGNFYGLSLISGTMSCATKVDSQRLLNQTNADLTVFPIQVNPENQRIYWSFGATQQDQFRATIVSLDLATCKVAWTKQIQDSTLSLDSQAGLAVNKDSMFLTENNALWVFSASNGNVVKNQHFDHYVLAPVVSGNEVFVASDLHLTAYT
jgi:outer membrane protein assembly factor BamB